MDNGLKRCCLCGKVFNGYGNDPWPVKDSGRCCDKCNTEKVIPARLNKLLGGKEGSEV